MLGDNVGIFGPAKNKKDALVIREIDRCIKRRERLDAQRKNIEKRKDGKKKKKLKQLGLKKAKEGEAGKKWGLRIRARVDVKKKQAKAKKVLKEEQWKKKEVELWKRLKEKVHKKEKKPVLKHSKKQIIERKTERHPLFGRIKIGKVPAKPEKIKHGLVSRKEKPGEPVVKEEEKELYEIEKGEIKEQEVIPKEVAPPAKPEKKAVEGPIEFEQREREKKQSERITTQKEERPHHGTSSKGSRRKGERRRPKLQAKRDLKQNENERKKAEFGGAEQKKVEIEKTDAVIEDVKLYTDTRYFVKNFDNCYEMRDLWAKRPKLYGNTNILFVSAKSSEGEEIAEMFPVLLRFDGTLESNAASRISRMSRNRFAGFLKHYKITEKIEDYNVVGRMNEWKGKEVKTILYKGRNQIFIPPSLDRKQI